VKTAVAMLNIIIPTWMVKETMETAPFFSGMSDKNSVHFHEHLWKSKVSYPKCTVKNKTIIFTVKKTAAVVARTLLSKNATGFTDLT